MAVLFLIFIVISKLFSIVTIQIYISTNSVQDFFFSLFSPTLVKSCFLVIAILTNMKVYLISLLAWLSMVISDIDIFSSSCWAFICLLYKNVY